MNNEIFILRIFFHSSLLHIFQNFPKFVHFNEVNNTTTYDPEKTSHLDPMPAIIMAGRNIKPFARRPGVPGTHHCETKRRQ